MAYRATSYWRSMVRQIGANRPFATSTTPKSRPFGLPLSGVMASNHNNAKGRAILRGDFFPVYVALGMIALSVSLGVFTMRQQLLYSPSVSVRKKRRETLPEVVEPDAVAETADKFVHKSFFRKLASAQEFDRVLEDPMRGGDPMVAPKKTESHKTVGIDPAKH
ncbi:hypothetical protein H6P81_013443 [Aristolochia fimbriata]|uniref:Transmembrane protein n=1 Tax=Aristolochia fimbriata TaxID=158543 RepID=A0AAV7EEP8_ARIFI|nr:hypothetical protein H6P81_013443 [Aristolochia fimbriata]